MKGDYSSCFFSSTHSIPLAPPYPSSTPSILLKYTQYLLNHASILLAPPLSPQCPQYPPQYPQYPQVSQYSLSILSIPSILSILPVSHRTLSIPPVLSASLWYPSAPLITPSIPLVSTSISLVPPVPPSTHQYPPRSPGIHSVLPVSLQYP